MRQICSLGNLTICIVHLHIYIHMNCILRIFVAIFSLYRPVKSALGVRSGRKFVYSPKIHPLDDPESFSLIGLASLTVYFQSGNKKCITYFCCHFQPILACKIGHRCQIGTKFCIQPSNLTLRRS